MIVFFRKAALKLYAVLRARLLFSAGSSLLRHVFPRHPPLNPDGKVLIHIGCGEFDDRRYINVDCRPGWHIDHVGDIEKCGTLFPEGYADLIYACHVLEHVSYRKLPVALAGLRRCLKREGACGLFVLVFKLMLAF